MPRFARSNPSTHQFYKGKHRFEHWYRDNTVYFITARVRDKRPVFATEAAKEIFWDRFTHYTAHHGFTPFITTVMNNHYHTLGYLKVGNELRELLRKLHGSVAKFVNDTLEEAKLPRHVPFWGNRINRDYFDGCIRTPKQFRLAYRYTQTQSTRARLCKDWRTYPHTRVDVELEPALSRAIELKAFLAHIPYPRYDTPRPD